MSFGSKTLDSLFQLMDDWGLGALRKPITDYMSKKNRTKNDYHNIIKDVMKKANSMREKALKLDTTTKVPTTEVLDEIQNRLNSLLSLPKSATSRDLVMHKRNQLEKSYKQASKDYNEAVENANRDQQKKIAQQQKLLDAASEYEQLAMAKANEYHDIGSYARAKGNSEVQQLRNEIDALFPTK